LITIVTHGDLDGLTSASILYDTLLNKNFKERINIQITQPFSLHSLLRRIGLGEKLEKLYILDIGLDEATWKRTYYELRVIRNRGIKIIWIDHHRATLQHLEELVELGITLLFSLKGSTVTIIGQNFLEETSNPEFYKKLVIMGEVGDKVRKISERDPLSKYIEYIGSSLVAYPADDNFKTKIVKLWARHKELINDLVLKRYEEAVQKLKELTKHSKERIIYETDKIMIIDLRNTRVHGYVGKIASYHASRSRKIVFILFNAGPFETIVTCRVPPSLAFNAMKILPDIAKKYGGGGGGHEKAASVRIPREMTEEFLKELQKIVL